MAKLIFRPASPILFAALGYLVLVVAGNNGIGTPMGDLRFAYQPWADEVLQGGKLLGISQPWVYPFPALAPILVSAILSPENLSTAWLLIQVLVTLALIAFMLNFQRDQGPSRQARFYASYALVALIVALGPVSISRIDAVSVQLAVFGIFLVSLQKDRAAAVLFTLAAWIKIWPIALFGAMVGATARIRTVMLTALFTTLSILTFGYLLGGNLNMLSFVIGQTERGLQIEAPVATPWLWLSIAGTGNSGIEYNQNLMTFEVYGDLTQLFAFWMGPIQLGAFLITFSLGLTARLRGVANINEIFVWTALTGVCDLIFFNKVGSPQFISWLAVPVVAGLLLATRKLGGAFFLVLALSLSTWLVYPILYDDILRGGVFGTLVLTLRNVLELALLVYANTRLTKLAFQKLAE